MTRRSPQNLPVQNLETWKHDEIFSDMPMTDFSDRGLGVEPGDQLVVAEGGMVTLVRDNEVIRTMEPHVDNPRLLLPLQNTSIIKRLFKR